MKLGRKKKDCGSQPKETPPITKEIAIEAVLKSLGGNTCWINPNSINELSDPHAKRYYTALRMFITELFGLIARWNLSVYDKGGQKVVSLTMPYDKDQGIYLTWEPKKIEKKTS